MDTLGYHYVVEATGCNQDILTDADRIREILLESARVGDMAVRTTYFYRFAPKAVSGVIIVAESHITIHTWPERGYAALDVYVCGESADPEKAIDFILKLLEAEHAHISEIKRGIEDDDVYSHAILTWEESPKGRR